MLTNSKVLQYNGTELQSAPPVHLLPFSIGPISILLENKYTSSRLYGTRFCPPNMNHIAGIVHISGKSINKIKPYIRKIFQKATYQKPIWTGGSVQLLGGYGLSRARGVRL